jgi:hypothetical protein
MNGELPEIDREASDRAAAQAEALIAAMYRAELAGRPLTARQRDMQVRAERWARHFQRQAEREGRL